MDREELKQQFKEYLWRSFVSEMWYGASTESWDSIVDGFFDHYYHPQCSKREALCLTKLADEYLTEWENPQTSYSNTDEAYIKGVYDFSDWLKKKYGEK